MDYWHQEIKGKLFIYVSVSFEELPLVHKLFSPAVSVCYPPFPCSVVALSSLPGAHLAPHAPSGRLRDKEGEGPVPRADQTRRREHFGRPSRG